MNMQCLPLLLLSCLALLPGGAIAGSGETVRCESKNGRPSYCRIGLGGEARLLRTLSDAECVEGDSWGSERGAVWVDRGCRAEFTIARDHGDDAQGGRKLRCESAAGRSNLCAADTRGGVVLMRQLSRSACIRGRNWGWDDTGVWVSGGCRAEFRLVGGTRSGHHAGAPRPEPARRLRCESEDGRDRLCAVDTRGGVRLLEQRSRTPCVEGETWGYDARGVWVAGGCRAEFETGLGVASGWGGGRSD